MCSKRLKREKKVLKYKMAYIIRESVELFHRTFDDTNDPRIKDWFILATPYPLVFIISSYLYFVLKCGPQFMKNRRPFQLDNVIRIYNIIQIIGSAYVFYWLVQVNSSDLAAVMCSKVHYSYDPKSLALLDLFWKAMVLRFLDLLETVFFILRKKNNQASFLHIYHHVTTLMLMWIGLNCCVGPMTSFPIIINSFIHTVMYFYYLMSNLGSTCKAIVNPWKKYLTTLQMAQFLVIIIYSLRSYQCDTNINPVHGYYFIPNIMVLFYLFYGFYTQSYDKKSHSSQFK